MTATITCKQCGATNRLGVLFCAQCGAKLDLTEKNVQKSVKKERKREAREAGSSVTILVRWLRWAVFALVLGGLVALFVPAGGAGELGERVDAERLDQKIDMLRAAILDMRAQQLVVFEREINAYLAEGVAGAVRPEGGLGFALEAIRVDLAEDGLTAWFQGRLGPLPLTYTVTGDGGAGPQGWAFVPRSVSIGHFPVPKFLRGRVEKQLALVFAGMVEERQVLKRIVLWDPREDEVRVGTGGRAAP